VTEKQGDSLARLECRAQAAHLASHRCKIEMLELQRKLRDPGASHNNANVNAEALVGHLSSVAEQKQDAVKQYAGKAKRLKVSVWDKGCSGMDLTTVGE